jgi:hypothetical protein
LQALSTILLDSELEVVDIEEECIVDVADRGINVARHGDVD